MTSTARGQAKAERHDALVSAASLLFAQHGYTDVSLEDIGAAAGVSGPAVYRHFAGKQALLGAVLVEVSQRLVEGGQSVCTDLEDPQERMDALIRFHVDFAVRKPDVIRLQDRDVDRLGTADRQRVRSLQRRYIAFWIDALTPLVPDGPARLRLRVQACFGLINSTPHSTGTMDRTTTETRRLLIAMARAAILAD